MHKLCISILLALCAINANAKLIHVKFFNVTEQKASAFLKEKKTSKIYVSKIMPAHGGSATISYDDGNTPQLLLVGMRVTQDKTTKDYICTKAGNNLYINTKGSQATVEFRVDILDPQLICVCNGDACIQPN